MLRRFCLINALLLGISQVGLSQGVEENDQVISGVIILYEALVQGLFGTNVSILDSLIVSFAVFILYVIFSFSNLFIRRFFLPKNTYFQKLQSNDGRDSALDVYKKQLNDEELKNAAAKIKEFFRDNSKQILETDEFRDVLSGSLNDRVNELLAEKFSSLEKHNIGHDFERIVRAATNDMRKDAAWNNRFNTGIAATLSALLVYVIVNNLFGSGAFFQKLIESQTLSEGQWVAIGFRSIATVTLAIFTYYFFRARYLAVLQSREARKEALTIDLWLMAFHRASQNDQPKLASEILERISKADRNKPLGAGESSREVALVAAENEVMSKILDKIDIGVLKTIPTDADKSK